MTRYLIALFLLALVSAAGGQTIPATVPFAPVASPRVVQDLDQNWAFHKGKLEAGAAAGVQAPAGDWEKIVVPHTWNNMDGQDGGDNYYKGDGWYRRTVTVGRELAGKELYLRFQGVNRDADVYVNGQLLGSHEGGTQAFCMDATKMLHAGENVLAVRATNEERTFAPISADFTFWGGIYRPVELVAVNPLHFSLTDFSSPGVYISTPQVTENEAKVHFRTIIENADASYPHEPQVCFVEVKDRDGAMVAQASVNVTPELGKSTEVTADLSIPHPHLWNGRPDPYLYSLSAMISPVAVHETRANVGDGVYQTFGVRTFSIDPVKGFILNGKPYDLHGVNRHQDRLNKGWAIANEDHLEDMAIIKEMGCTAIRLAHYQQSQFFYDLCDKEGMVVWAEVPVVNTLNRAGAAGAAPTAEFLKNAQQQYAELIHQCYNHPSICFWSAGNEVDPPANNPPADTPVFEFYRGQRDLAHSMDPSRPSVAAWRERFFPAADVTDYFGLNEYLGWYTAIDLNTDAGRRALENYIRSHSQGAVAGKWAITEYGAGASIYFHSENPTRMDHSEEYQCLVHENTWHVLVNHPEVWGKFIWNMFDFAADDRFEGDTPGRNDKGLVTYDRKTRKDAFYFYKANWNDAPTIHINSKRFAVRGVAHIPVEVYSNAAWVSIKVNGVELTGLQNEDCVVEWTDVALKEGLNTVTVSANFGNGQTLSDTAMWTYKPGAPAEVYEAQADVMKEALKAGPPRPNFPPKPRN